MDDKIKGELKEIFSSYSEIIAVYLFGSYLGVKENARDMDLAVLLRQPVKSQVDIYLSLYPRIAKIIFPLDPDILFLHSATLPVRFGAVSTGEVIYSCDEELRTDFEYIVSGEYMDFKYHLNMAQHELFEAIQEEGTFV